VTFPEYDGATKWHIFRNSSPTRNTKMAAAKTVTNISTFIIYIQQCSSGSVTPRNEIPTTIPTFSGSRISKTPLSILPRVRESRNFKMAAAKPVIYIQIHIRNVQSISQLLGHLETKFQRLSHVFWHQELKAASADVAPCNRKSEIQDGGH